MHLLMGERKGNVPHFFFLREQLFDRVISSSALWLRDYFLPGLPLFRFTVWVTSSLAKLRGVYSLSSPSRRLLQACVCFLGRPPPMRARLVHPRCGVLQADAFRPGYTQDLQSRCGRGQDATRRGSYGTARVGPHRAKGLKRACAELECAESLIESDPS